jgi:hypothetical protein
MNNFILKSNKYSIMKKYLICVALIALILIAGCTSCVKNECKRVITPANIDNHTFKITDTDGTVYWAKDIYTINQLGIGRSNLVTYIDGNPKLLVTVY